MNSSRLLHDAVQDAADTRYVTSGAGALSSAALYEQVPDRDLSRIDIDRVARAWSTRGQLEQIVRRTHANPIITENAVPQSAAKYIDADHLRQRLVTVREHWSKLRERLIGQLMPPAGCPVTPEEIGLDRACLRASYAQARQIRSRYTIFDLAAETGIFEQCVANLFASSGFWSIP